MFEEDKSYQFLMGLNNKLYGQISSQILTQDLLPPLRKIFNMVTQEEQHKRIMTGRDDRTEIAAAFAVIHEDKAHL